MSEILTLEQIEDEIGMLIRGGGDADLVLRQFMALREENARLNEALANWHDNEARWIGNSERYPDADLREARSVLRDLAASASIRRAALAPAAEARCAEMMDTADDAVKFLGRLAEVTWNAGYPGGDRDQTMRNLVALVAERDRLAKALKPFTLPESYVTDEEECRKNAEMDWCAVHSFRWPCPVGPARAALAGGVEGERDPV